MSPLPSPSPLRRAFVRALFSPAGLLFGFVVLLIVTCPGARGEGFSASLALNGGLAATADLPALDVPVAPANRSTTSFARSTRFDRAPVSSARTATPVERKAQASAIDTEAFSRSRAAVPLLVDPLLDEISSGRPAISPMIGPAVGVQPKPRVSRR